MEFYPPPSPTPKKKKEKKTRESATKLTFIAQVTYIGTLTWFLKPHAISM